MAFSGLLEIELHDQVLELGEVAVFMELEVLLIELADVLRLGHVLEVLLEVDQFCVLAGVVGEDGDAVFELEDVGVGGVVDENHAAEVAVDDAQVLRVDVLVDLHAVAAIEPVPDVLAVGVELVQHHVGVGLVAGGEGDDLVGAGHPLQEADGVGADRDVGLGGGAVLDLDRQHQVVRLRGVLLAVDDRLVDVQDQRLLAGVGLRARQVHLPLLDLREGGGLDLVVVPQHLQRDDEVLERALVLPLDRRCQLREVVGLGAGVGSEVELAAEEVQLALAARHSGAHLLGAGRFVEWRRRAVGIVVGLLLADDVLVSVELPLGLADLLLQLRQRRLQVGERGAVLLPPFVLKLPPQVLHHLQVHRVPRFPCQSQALPVDVRPRGVA